MLPVKVPLLVKLPYIVRDDEPALRIPSEIMRLLTDIVLLVKSNDPLPTFVRFKALAAIAPERVI